jgi:predicted phage terminase large subunit-like protein
MANEKKKIDEWEEFVKMIRRATAIDHSETTDEKIKRKLGLEADAEAWFAYYFPMYVFADAAPFHRAATQRLLDNPEWYEVRMWARELAKSTRSMMEILYLMLTGRKRYLLLISNSLDNATRLLAPFKIMLEHNQRIINDYGLQERYGNWQAAEFVTNAGLAFRALGAGQSPRGTRSEEARPDILLFDDVDTDTDCLNPDIVAKKWRWIEEAAIGTRSISAPTLILFCGNRIATDCCIGRATQLADHTDIINIRDDEGRSVWPNKNSELDIDRVLMQKSYAAAQKEYFNNPIVEGAVFKCMAYKECPPLKEYTLLVCYTDPSFKDGRNNDYKATVLVGKWQDEFHVIKAYIDQTTIANMIGWHYNIVQYIGQHNCYYYMESNFLQGMIFEDFHQVAKERGRSIPINGDDRNKPNKFTRIECLLEPLNRNGKLYLNLAEKHNPHMQRLEEQFLAFSPMSTAHDDGPDAVEGAVWRINNKLFMLQPDSALAIRRPVNPKRF